MKLQRPRQSALGSGIGGSPSTPPTGIRRLVTVIAGFALSGRALLLAGIVALSTGADLHAQVGARIVEETAKREAFAEARALEQADLLRAELLGSLNADSGLAFRRWGVAVSKWKDEKGSGAAPLLAQGILFDCLSRLVGVQTPGVVGEIAEPNYFSMAKKRPVLALKAFDAALKIDPNLIEARMRAARIRALRDPKFARDLERIAADPTTTPFSYLAAVSRAEVALSQHDAAGAIFWYERARDLQPGSSAAAIALNSLKPVAARSFGLVAAKDPYYSYPCTILSPNIEAALSERIRSVVLK